MVLMLLHRVVVMLVTPMTLKHSSKPLFHLEKPSSFITHIHNTPLRLSTLTPCHLRANHNLLSFMKNLGHHLHLVMILNKQNFSSNATAPTRWLMTPSKKSNKQGRSWASWGSPVHVGQSWSSSGNLKLDHDYQHSFNVIMCPGSPSETRLCVDWIRKKIQVQTRLLTSPACLKTTLCPGHQRMPKSYQCDCSRCGGDYFFKSRTTVYSHRKRDRLGTFLGTTRVASRNVSAQGGPLSASGSDGHSDIISEENANHSDAEGTGHELDLVRTNDLIQSMCQLRKRYA